MDSYAKDRISTMKQRTTLVSGKTLPAPFSSQSITNYPRKALVTMSIHKKTSNFNDQFDPPLVHPNFFQRARCAGCSARLIDFAGLVAVPTSAEEIRIAPLCADCVTHAYASDPTGISRKKTLYVWSNVARYFQLEDASRAKKAVKK